MTRSFQRNFLRIIILSVGITVTLKVLAQQDVVVPDDDSSVIYDASFFAEFSPVNVNDMINLIPGVNIAMDYRGGSNNRRGLGPGENEILINGQRQTGKNNEGRSQLSAISANQVDYIQIIRSTSEEMDVRSGGQVVNVVLLDSESRSSMTVEAIMERYQDGTLEPGAKFSWAGQDLSLIHI